MSFYAIGHRATHFVPTVPSRLIDTALHNGFLALSAKSLGRLVARLCRLSFLFAVTNLGGSLLGNVDHMVLLGSLSLDHCKIRGTGLTHLSSDLGLHPSNYRYGQSSSQGSCLGKSWGTVKLTNRWSPCGGPFFTLV